MSGHRCRGGNQKWIPKTSCVTCMRAERNELLAACKMAESYYTRLPKYPDRGHDIAAELAVLRKIADKIQAILRATNHPELPEGEIPFTLGVTNELLVACEALLDHCPCVYGGFEGGEVVPQPCDVCDRARATIAKVRGEK